MNDNTPVKPLPKLLEELNTTLGWRPADMARFFHKDPSELSKILRGMVKPQNDTLRYFAEKYQEAGLEGVTFELLQEARDQGGRRIALPGDIPVHWLRLIQLIMTLDQDLQDTLYHLFFEQLQQFVRIAHRGATSSPRQRYDVDDVE